MANEKFLQLLHNLHEATKQDKLKWNPSVKDGTFRVALGEGLVRIEEIFDPEDESTGYKASLLNRQGTTLEEFYAWYAPEFEWMRDFYFLARRSAYDIDAVLDSMVADLKAGRTRPLPDAPPRTARIDYSEIDPDDIAF